MKPLYSKVRFGIICIFFGVAFVLFSLRLVSVQLVDGGELREKARRQYEESVSLPAPRGEIFDAAGNKVAVNANLHSLFAYPLTDEDIAACYKQMAVILGKTVSELRLKYDLKKKRFRWIKRGLTSDEFARFERGPKGCGLFLREEPTRNYPYGGIGRGILGFVDLDNKGRSGIELEMENKLVGSDGLSIIQKDGKGAGYLIREIPIRNAVAGQSVVLTIDWDKQQIVEKELAKAVQKYKAKGGMAVFVDIRTGAIIAAAECDTNLQSPDKPMKLGAVANVFEPGSVFKIVVAAAAIDDGSIRPSDMFFAENGFWAMGKHSLRDDHKFGWLSFRQAFENSSNIIMGKVANKIGGDKVLSMAQRLGFGRKTRCGLNCESKGVINAPYRWSEFTTSTYAIGHGVSVTALQLAQAFAVIASGGYLNQPYIIKGCLDDQGRIVEQHRSQPIKVLDKKVTAVLDSFLRGVVQNGTGKPLSPTPFAIAGKTGTAEKPNLETGGYNKHQFMASFGGYFPADSPLVAGVVVLDEPEPIHYGGYTAGPTFRDIALQFGAMDNYQLAAAPDTTTKNDVDSFAVVVPDSELISLPDLSCLSRVEAKCQIDKLDLTVTFSGYGSRVINTWPAPFSHLQPKQEVRCFMGPGTAKSFPSPDLGGLTLREAIAVIDQYGLTLSGQGQGIVIQQDPKAGSIVKAGDAMRLTFARSKEPNNLTARNGQGRAGIADCRQ